MCLCPSLSSLPFALFTPVYSLDLYYVLMAGTVSGLLKLFLEMYMPQPAAWRWRSYRLGVRDRSFGVEINDKTGIQCRRKNHFVKELQSGIQQYLHLFLEMEVSALSTLYFVVHIPNIFLVI